MTPKHLLTLILLFSTLIAAAQVRNPYDEHLRLAEQYFQQKEYLKSAQSYTRAFLTNKDRGRIDHRYSAARSWALAGKPDSAFYHLGRIVNSGYYINIDEISNDHVFLELRADERWESLLGKVRENKELARQKKEEVELKLNKPLVAILDSIHHDDQHYRKQLDEITKKYGWKSAETQAQWKIIREKDSLNLIKVQTIIDRYGWLGPEEIGLQGNHTLFLVIQHSDLATQLKYLPVMRAAVEKRKAEARDLVMLEDRVLMRQGKRQRFGTQMSRLIEDSRWYLYPVEDPDNLDKRRAAVGLPPISDYLKHYNITWDLEQYKKDLPQLEEKERLMRTQT